ncbi:hypothetical protein GC209_13555 [bacterium]|nr:hypothetical protein [bacterium]
MAKAAEIFALRAVVIDPRPVAADLGAAQRRLTAMAMAISQSSKVPIFDDLSSALTVSDVERLIPFLRKRKARGVVVINVSRRPLKPGHASRPLIVPGVHRADDCVAVIREPRLCGHGDLRHTQGFTCCNALAAGPWCRGPADPQRRPPASRSRLPSQGANGPRHGSPWIRCRLDRSERRYSARHSRSAASYNLGLLIGSARAPLKLFITRSGCES